MASSEGYREPGHDNLIHGDKSLGLTLKSTKNHTSSLYASARASSLSSRRKNLPVAVLGSSSMNSIWRGYL